MEYDRQGLLPMLHNSRAAMNTESSQAPGTIFRKRNLVHLPMQCSRSKSGTLDFRMVGDSDDEPRGWQIELGNPGKERRMGMPTMRP